MGVALAADLLQRSDILGLRHLGGHLALLCATGWAVAVSSLWAGWLCWAVALAVHGVVLTHLYMPFHEATHGTAFESQPLNRIVAWSLGVVIWMNADAFRWFHKEHHEHTQQWGLDPELPGANGGLGGYANKLLGGEMAVALCALWRSALLGRRAEDPWVPETARDSVVASTRCQVAAYVFSLALSARSRTLWWALVHLWLLPLLVGQPALWGHFIAQHTATEHDGDPRHTSRVVLTHPAYEWLSWGMNYHAVHHMHPRIPFHKLRSAFATAEGEFEFVERKGYFGVHASIIRAALAR